MYKLYYFILLSLFSQMALAQDYLQGQVVDGKTQQPLEGATVRLLRNSITLLTDPSGFFTIRARKQQTLMVSFIGYVPIMISVNAGTKLKISLQQGVSSLSDIQLLSNRVAGFNNISRVDLDIKPVRNTQQLLSLVPGLITAQHAGGGKAEQVFLRGFDCDHGTDVEISVDGLPVNMVSHAHGQGYADAHFIIPETINNMSFGLGPYYAAEGNQNTAGYVRFNTYQCIEHNRFQLEAGRFHTYRGLTLLDLLPGNKSLQTAYLAAEYFYTDGPTLNKQNFYRLNLFGKYHLNLNLTTQFTASLSTFGSQWDASGQVPQRAVEKGLVDRFGSLDPSEGGNTKRQNLNVILSHHYEDGTTWENQAYFSHYRFNLYSDFSFYLIDSIQGDEINQAEKRNLLGMASTFRQNHFLKKGSLQSSYGIGLRYDATTNTRLAHVAKRQFLDNIQLGDIREANVYGYARHALNIAPWLLEGGLRFDYLHFFYLNKLSADQFPSQGKIILSPKLNIQYTVNNHLQFYVKGGKGFHSNDTRVVVAHKGQEILPAAYGTDFGLCIRPSNALYINIAAWYLYLDEEFIYAGDDGNVLPSGRTKRKGIDILGRYQFSPNLSGDFTFNYTIPRSVDAPKGRDFIPLAPTLTSSGGLYYRKKQGWNGSFTYKFMKDRAANENNSIIAKGYFIMDGSLNYSTIKYEVGLAVENILNRKWNEAQFATESRLQQEPSPVTDLSFTPGTPLFARLKLAVFF